MVLTLLGDDRYWLTERQKIQNLISHTTISTNNKRGERGKLNIQAAGISPCSFASISLHGGEM